MRLKDFFGDILRYWGFFGIERFIWDWWEL